MSYDFVGEAAGKAIRRKVYWVTPISMPGPYKYWGIKVVECVLSGPGAGVRERYKTCHTLEEAKKYIQDELEGVR